jgi:hypothetical protein
MMPVQGDGQEAADVSDEDVDFSDDGVSFSLHNWHMLRTTARPHLVYRLFKCKAVCSDSWALHTDDEDDEDVLDELEAELAAQG